MTAEDAREIVLLTIDTLERKGLLIPKKARVSQREAGKIYGSQRKFKKLADLGYIKPLPCASSAKNSKKEYLLKDVEQLINKL